MLAVGKEYCCKIMKVKFLAPLKEGRLYPGIIRDYQVKDGKLKIFVEIEDEPDNLYLSSQRMIMRAGSPFYFFCKKMGIGDNGFDLDYLYDLPVQVRFKKGTDGNMYISDMDVLLDEEDEDDEEE